MGKSNWKEVMPYEKTTKLDYLVCFENHIVINGRSNTHTRARAHTHTHMHTYIHTGVL
jgi:protease II